MLLLEPTRELVRADAGRHRKHAEVVGHAALPRRDEVCERAIRLRVRDDFLLPQHREAHHLAPARIVREHDDVVAIGVGGPEAVHAARGQQLLGNDAVEERPRVLVQLTCRGAVLGMLEDAREIAL